MKILAYPSFILLGFFTSSLIYKHILEPKEGQGLEPSHLTTKRSSSLKSASGLSQTQFAGESEFPTEFTQLKSDSFRQGVASLYQTSRNPLLSDEILTAHIYETSFDEWERILREETVRRKDVLDILGKRLTTEDPSRALKVLLEGIRVSNVRDFETFRNSVLRQAVVEDGSVAIDALNEAEPSAHRQAIAQALGKIWLKKDPAAVAEQFSSLVRLSNASEEVFAGQIVKTWLKRDREALREHVENLPAGEEKRTFEKALDLVLKK